MSSIHSAHTFNLPTWTQVLYVFCYAMGEDYADANQLAINNLSLSDLLVQRDITAALNSTLLCQLSPETMSEPI